MTFHAYFKSNLRNYGFQKPSHLTNAGDNSAHDNLGKFIRL